MAPVLPPGTRRTYQTFSGCRGMCGHCPCRTAHQLPDVTIVADAGMISEANPKEIEAAALSFILGMRIPRVPVPSPSGAASTRPDICDGHIFIQPWQARRAGEQTTQPGHLLPVQG